MVEDREYEGTVKLRSGRARLYTDDGSLILIPFPAEAPLGEQEKEAVGTVLFGYLRNRTARLTGTVSGERLYNAREIGTPQPENDPAISPASHDEMARKLAAAFQKDSESVARRLNDAGIFTASAFYHRLKDYQPEIRAFAEYLKVPQTRVKSFLESMETDQDTAGLVKAPPKIPVGLGVSLEAVAKRMKAPPKVTASGGPPLFPPSQRTPRLPPQVDLRNKVTAVRNQAFRGTCVAHTAAAMLEHELIRYSPLTRRLDLSEQYLYWACKQVDGNPQMEGSLIEYAAKVLRQRFKRLDTQQWVTNGVCKEHLWKYNRAEVPGNEAQGPPPGRALATSKFGVSKATKVKASSIKALKARLAARHCVGISVYTYHFWQDGYTWREGIISLPISIAPDGAHAICLVGYKDRDDSHSDGYFIFKNSWGDTWGVNRKNPGYGSLPYRYVLEEAIEAWMFEV